jgi:hypothetical protein
MHRSPLVLGLTCWRRCRVPRQADAEGDLLVLGRYVEATVIEVAVGFEQNLSEVPVAE